MEAILDRPVELAANLVDLHKAVRAYCHYAKRMSLSLVRKFRARLLALLAQVLGLLLLHANLVHLFEC